MSEEIILNELHRFLRDVNHELLKLKELHNIVEADRILYNENRQQLDECLNRSCALFQLWTPLDRMIYQIDNPEYEIINIQRSINRKLRKIFRLTQAINGVLAESLLMLTAQVQTQQQQ
ncbi:hypothetical protein DERF_009935 [Dermatophagoides farinae]|uniref:Uncharacterized protein n=1 Tax=Dermatophagoides farinae TaxID=6954 RepID=A0A922HUW7_DERFA|nr:hypothetical protein DERF_009935 [Dermatophagoides farinae]